MNKKKIFIACDTTSSKKLKEIINQSKTSKLKISYKIGLEFFLSPSGRNFISKIKNREIFLDLKLNDIPKHLYGCTIFFERFKEYLVSDSTY